MYVATFVVEVKAKRRKRKEARRRKKSVVKSRKASREATIISRRTQSKRTGFDYPLFQTTPLALSIVPSQETPPSTKSSLLKRSQTPTLYPSPPASMRLKASYTVYLPM